MQLPGIGQLTEHGDYWRLVYDQCGHSQELARLGIEDPLHADAYIRGGIAYCLSCQAAARTADGRPQEFPQLLEPVATEPPARLGERDQCRGPRERR